MNCTECKDFFCKHRSQSSAGGECFYESKEQWEKLLSITTKATLDYIDWSTFRREAAKDFISGMLANVSPAADKWTTPDIVTAALDIADELIRQLKEEKK